MNYLPAEAGADIYGGEMPERRGTFAQMVAVLGQHSNKKNAERASPSVSAFRPVSGWMQTLIKGGEEAGKEGAKVFKSAQVVKARCFSALVQSFLPCWTLLNSVILGFPSDSLSACFLFFFFSPSLSRRWRGGQKNVFVTIISQECCPNDLPTDMNHPNQEKERLRWNPSHVFTLFSLCP